MEEAETIAQSLGGKSGGKGTDPCGGRGKGEVEPEGEKNIREVVDRILWYAISYAPDDSRGSTG